MPLTHRQFLALQAFLDEQWNQPSRTDHYLMAIRIAIEAFAAGFAKNGKPPKFSEMKLKFGQEEQAPVLSREEAAAISKARWFAATGFDPNKRKKAGPPANGKAKEPPRKAG